MEELKNLEATNENKNIIMNLMQKTLSNRNLMRNDGKTAIEIMECFPHITKYNGDLVYNELNYLLFPQYYSNYTF